MRLILSFWIPLVTSSLIVGAWSSAPAPNVIIVQQSPSGGGQNGTGSAAPISFRPAGDGGPSGSAGAPSTGAGSSSGGGSASVPAAASGLPCDLATYLAQNCLSCHGATPIPSALASLVTASDLKATSKEDPTKNEAELSLARMKNAASPMPPGAPPAAASVAILENWINAGYPVGSCGSGVGDGGAVAQPPPPPSVFEGAPAFATRAGPRAHNAGKDCMSCHRQAGGETPQFSFGGTVYDGMGNAVAGAEVRLVDASGKATSVYTSSTGTFYSRGTGFAGPAHIGVRDATHSADMLTALQATNGGACSSCHCTGTSCSVAPIHLP